MPKGNMITFRLSDGEVAELEKVRQQMELAYEPAIKEGKIDPPSKSDALRALIHRKDSNTPPLINIDVLTLAGQVSAALADLEAAGEVKYHGDFRADLVHALMKAQEQARRKQAEALGIGKVRDIVPGEVAHG